MRAVLFAGLTFGLAWCAMGGIISGLLPLITGIGVVPPQSQVLIGLCGGALFAIFPAALVASLMRRKAGRFPPQTSPTCYGGIGGG